MWRGADTGWGMPTTATPPTPAGPGNLKISAAFKATGISPIGLLLGALPPTLIAIMFFWFVG